MGLTLREGKVLERNPQAKVKKKREKKGRDFKSTIVRKRERERERQGYRRERRRRREVRKGRAGMESPHITTTKVIIADGFFSMFIYNLI